MFLISTGIFLSKIYSQFFHCYEGILNLSIYEAKVFYNNTDLENNGILIIEDLSTLLSHLYFFQSS